MRFYEEVFGGTASVMTFADAGGGDAPHSDHVMHGQLESPSGFTLMCSDMAPGVEHQAGTNSAISLSGDDIDELRGYWRELTADGQVTVPLEPQMWGDTFGACTDRFGVPRMVNIAGPQG